jgi:hypothetical protein
MVVQKEILAQMPSFRQQAADQAENKEKAAPVEKKAK